MFGIGSTELLVIAVVALLVIGPSKLPQMMRMLGRGVAEFRRMSSDVQNTLNAEVERAESEARKKKSQAELFPDEEAKPAASKPKETKPKEGKPETAKPTTVEAEPVKAAPNDSTTADDTTSREA